MATQSGFLQIFGGSFTDSAGRPYAGGSLYAKPSYETVVAGNGQISSQEVFLGVLDDQGNLPQSAKVSLWANDSTVPFGTVYALRVTDATGAPSWGPVNFYIIGESPVNLGAFVPTSLGVSYPAPIIQNPINDQTIQSNDLLPADGNTTQSLGNADAPWNAVFNNATFNNTVSFNVVNALSGFQVAGSAPAGDVLRGNGSEFIAAVLSASDLSNGVTGTVGSNVVLKTSPSITTPTFTGNTQMTGAFTKYNNSPLQGGGIPSESYQSLNTGLTANFNAGSAVTIFTPIVPTMVRIAAVEATGNSPTSASLPKLTVGWTDASGIARTLDILATTSTSSSGTVATGAGTCYIFTNNSTPVTVTSASYAAGSGTALAYSLAISCEVL